MTSDVQDSFGKWRGRLWPIHTWELKKIIPLLLMKLFISFNYGILTAMKDAFVVTAKGGGAEVIPILKGWIVLPVALAATLLYTKLTNVFRRTTLFYGIITFFIAFIALYGFVLYPNLDALTPNASADWLLGIVGNENSHWIAIYRNWMQSLFFVIAELWGGIVIFLLFWGFMNHISNFNDAKRYYNLCIVGGDIAQMLTGPLVCYYTGRYLAEQFPIALKCLVGYVLLFGIIIMLLYWWINRYILTDKKFFNSEDRRAPSNEKMKLSLKESLKFIVKSKYLRCIAVMVVAYGLTMNLVEVTWKANLKLAYPDTGSYQSFMASIATSVGMCSFLFTSMLGGLFVRLLGWHFCAQITPIVVGFGSVVFLILFQGQEFLAPFLGGFGITPLMLIVMFGAFQNVSSKVCKYVFFDSTKEMSYIPLDQESKVKGKAAIDVVGSRLGKSGAAWIQLVLIQLAGTGSVLSITHFLLPFIASTVIFWIFSVRSLNKQFIEQKATAT